MDGIASTDVEEDGARFAVAEAFGGEEVASLAGGGQHADDDIGLGQHLVESRQLVHLIEPGTLTATVADAEHPHAKMLSGVGDMLPYAAGTEQQQRLSLQALIGMALPDVPCCCSR